MIADTIVIYQVINGYDGDAEKDAVVLYNPTSQSVSLNGMAIKHGGSETLYNLSGSALIAPNKYYLIGKTGAQSVEGINADELQNFSISGAASVDKTWVGIFYNSGNDTIDLVGFGAHASNVTAEGLKISEDLAIGNSLVRKPADLFNYRSGGLLDTNNNQTDFRKISSIPASKNSASPSEKLSFIINAPASAAAGESFALSCSIAAVYNNVIYGDSVITDYTGAKAWADISVSGGNISANNTTLFVNGLLTDTFVITGITGNVVITISDGNCTGSATINITSIIPIALTPTFSYPVAQDTNAHSFTLFGTGGANDSVAFYVNDIFSGETKIDNDSNWSYPLNIANGLKVNDTNIIKAVSFAAGKLNSDTVMLTIFIDTAAPVLTGQLVISDASSRNIYFNFNLFNDSSSIDTYITEISTDSNFSSPVIYFSSAAAVSIRLQDEGEYYGRVKAVDKFNQTSQYSNADTFILSVPKIVINEFNSDNTASANPPDANGNGVIETEKDDFIELYNYGDIPVNLNNWKLGRVGSFEITLPDITIAPKDFITIFDSADSNGFNVRGSYLFTSALSLSASTGELYYLFDTTNDTIDFITTVMSGDSEIDADQSITRYPDGTGVFIKSSLVHPMGKKATPNLPYNDMDGYCAAQITPSSIITGETFQLNISISADVNFAGGTIAITLPAYFPAFSKNAADSGCYAYSSSKTLQPQNFIEQSNKLLVTLADNFVAGDTVNILFGSSGKAYVDLLALTNDTIIVSSSDSNSYGGLTVSGNYPLTINLPVVTPPVIIAPVNNYKTSADSINIGISVDSRYIGDTLAFYRNGFQILQTAITSSALTLENIALTANSYNQFYCIIIDTYIPNLNSDSSNILVTLNDIEGPIPVSLSFADTYILTPELSFPAFSDSVNIISYILHIDNSRDFLNPSVYFASVNKISVTSPLTAGVTYYVKIRAIDELNNNGVFSDSAIIRIVEQLPAPVINYPVNMTDTNTNEIIISGTVAPHPDVEKIKLFIDNILADSAYLSSNGADSIFSFTISNLTNDTHKIEVRTFNKINEILSDASNSIIFLYDTDGPAPAEINISDKYSNTVVLDLEDFNDSSSIVKYYFHISGNSDFSDSTVYESDYSYLQLTLDYGVYYLKIRALDKLGNFGSFSNSDSFEVKLLPAANHIVISEIQVGGQTSDDEFVELYNPTNSAVSLSGWSLSRYTSTGTKNSMVSDFGDAVIQPKGYYLVTHTAYSGNVASDKTHSSGLAANNSIVLTDNTNTIIDMVGLVGAHPNFTEGDSGVFPANNQSIERKALSTSDSVSMTTGADRNIGNGFDSDNNAFDFIVRTTPNPQNSSYFEPNTDAPENIELIKIVLSSQAVLLYWKESAALDFDYYKIYYSADTIINVRTSVLFDTINVKADTQLAVTGLTNNIQYYFAVTAIDNAGNENIFPSSILSGIPLASLKDDTGPLAISDLTVIDSTPVSVSLRWTTPADLENQKPDKYELRYSTAAINNMTDFYNAAGDTSMLSKKALNAGLTDSYILQNLLPNTQYYIGIVSIDVFGNTSGLTVTTVKTPSGRSSNIVISEVAVGVGNASTEFIELYNPDLRAVDLSNYQLRISGANIPLTFRNRIIMGYGFFLLATNDLAEGDAYWSGAKIGGGGGSAVQILDASGKVVDAVAWSESGQGHDLYKEGNVIQVAFSTNMSIERKAKYNSTSAMMTTGSDSLAGNAFDSNNNSFDFVVNSVLNYQNSDSNYEIPYGITNEDTLPPAGVNDLRSFVKLENGAVLLTWTRVADYDKYGTNPYVRYIIKYSDTEILNDTMFDNASLLTASFKNLNDTFISYITSNLTPGVKYYFAVKAADRFDNVSALSNTVAGHAYILPPSITPNIADNSIGILPCAKVILTFSDNMDTLSVINNLHITPDIDSTIQWLASNQLVISADWLSNSNYRITIMADDVFNAAHTAALDGNGNKISEGAPLDNYILNFSTSDNFVRIPAEETSLYNLYVNNILLTSSDFTIFLNNADTVRLNFTGINENDRWTLTYAPPETGYFLNFSTEFRKIITDTSYNYFINNQNALDRMIKISVFTSSGVDIENADINLKFYYSAINADSSKLGIFRSAGIISDKFDLKEIVDRNYFDNTVSADNYTVTDEYIDIDIKKTGYFAAGQRAAFVEFINSADLFLSVSAADSVVCANPEMTGLYTGDTLQKLLLKSNSTLNNDSVNLYCYIDNAPYGSLDGNDIYTAVFNKSAADSKFYELNGQIDFTDNLKLLIVADFKNVQSGDMFEIYLDTDSVIMHSSDNANINNIIKSNQTITFAEYGALTDYDTVLINEVCITPKSNWTAAGFRYDPNNLPEFTASENTANEYVELYNKSGKIIDLTGWRLIVYKSSSEDTLVGILDMTNYDTNVYFSRNGNPTKFYPDEYLVVGIPFAMIQNIGVYLFKDTMLIDSVSFGSYDDGNTADNAADGSSSGQSNESLSRYPNGKNSNIDSADFVKMNGTPGLQNILLPATPVITFPTAQSSYTNYLNAIAVEGSGSNSSDGIKVYVNDIYYKTVSVANSKWSALIDTAAGLDLNGTTVIKVFAVKSYAGVEYKSNESLINIISGQATPVIYLLSPQENIFANADNKDLIFELTNPANLKSIETKLNGSIIANYVVSDKIYVSAFMNIGRNNLNIQTVDIFGNTANFEFDFYTAGLFMDTVSSAVVIDSAAFTDTSIVCIKIDSADTVNIFAPAKNGVSANDTFIVSVNMVDDENRYVIMNKVDTALYKTGFNGMTNYDNTAYTIFEIKVVDKRGRYSANDSSIFDAVEIRYDFSETTKNNVNIRNLRLYTFDEQAQKWVKLSDADCLITDNYISARLRHFSVYGAFASSILNTPQTNIDSAVVYPSPFIPNDNNPRTGLNYSGADNGSGIYIAGIRQNTQIEIFDISGRKIFDTLMTDDKSYYQWNVRTNKGASVASGVYIVVLTNNGQRVVKKIAIIK